MFEVTVFYSFKFDTLDEALLQVHQIEECDIEFNQSVPVKEQFNGIFTITEV